MTEQEKKEIIVKFDELDKEISNNGIKFIVPGSYTIHSDNKTNIDNLIITKNQKTLLISCNDGNDLKSEKDIEKEFNQVKIKENEILLKDINIQKSIFKEKDAFIINYKLVSGESIVIIKSIFVQISKNDKYINHLFSFYSSSENGEDFKDIMDSIKFE